VAYIRLAALQKAAAVHRLPKGASDVAVPAADPVKEVAPDAPVMDEYTDEDELVGG